MQDFILKAIALGSAISLGFYACKLWEHSIQFQKHKLYVESTVKIVEALMDKKGLHQKKSRIKI